MTIGTALLAAVLLTGCGGSKSVDELRSLGKKEFVQGNYTQAREYFLEGIAHAPSDRDLLFFTGMTYKREFILDSAQFYLKKVGLLFPDDRETHEQLLELSVALEDWENALTALGGLIRTGDRIEDHYFEFAEYWGRHNHPANAYFFIKKAIEIDPDQPNAYIQAANLASICEPGPQAVAWIDSAIERFGEDDAFSSNKAMLLARDERYAEAEKIYRELLAKDTTYAPALMNLANSLASQDSKEKKREALIYYDKTKTYATDKMLEDFAVDSLIEALREEIK